MKKLTVLILVLILALSTVLTGCTLPARGTPPPATATTSADVAAPGTTPDAGTVPTTGPTDTGILPTSTPLPAVTATSAAPVAPAAATSTPLPPVIQATPLPAASRVFFETGDDSATVDGELNAGQTLYYVVQGAAGQAMTVDAWSPNGDVTLGVFAGSTGQALLDAGLLDTNWTGTLPATQDYYLSITAGGGRSSYSVTVELSQLSSTTATATPLSPPPSGLFDPEAVYGEPDFEDPMTGTTVMDWWDEDRQLPNTDYIRLNVDGARFYVTGKVPGFSTWYFTWRDLSDFYLEATFDSASCSGQDAYGLIFRGPEHMAGVSYGYVVAFTCDGQLWVFRLDGANPFTAEDLVSLTPSQYINDGQNQHNTMGISADGDTLTIYANGHQIAQVADDTYDFGRFGVFVSPQWTWNYTYRLVRLTYWDFDD